MPSPKKKIYYYNSAPQYPRYSLEMIDVWDNAMEDTVRVRVLQWKDYVVSLV